MPLLFACFLVLTAQQPLGEEDSFLPSNFMDWLELIAELVVIGGAVFATLSKQLKGRLDTLKTDLLTSRQLERNEINRAIDVATGDIDGVGDRVNRAESVLARMEVRLANGETESLTARHERREHGEDIARLEKLIESMQANYERREADREAEIKRMSENVVAMRTTVEMLREIYSKGGP